MRILSFSVLFSVVVLSCVARTEGPILPGAERSDQYVTLLENKQVGVVANHASVVGDLHLVDFLISKGIIISRIYSPEHGFRGKEDAGAEIRSGIDLETGIEIISLYGKQKKPSDKDLQGIEIMLFDLQDAGVRFYTYISTLHYVMETCAENNISLVILDRPNPNLNYIDGPVLDPEFSSFVGMHPVPVVYGMTIGEYARMINGEKWLRGGIQCDLEIIKCADYTRSSVYIPPVKPSPNLPNFLSIKLYPSLCFFEGTKISVGRGTDFPFQVFGHPELLAGDFYFTPEPKHGSAMNPKLKGEKCRGFDLRTINAPESIDAINLNYLILAYNNFPDKEEFFNSYFNSLSGNNILKEQIIMGLSEEEIRESWQEGIEKFREVRRQYLLY